MSRFVGKKGPIARRGGDGNGGIPDKRRSRTRADRVLSRTPDYAALYRKWAAIRLATLQPWINKWAMGEMYAGAGHQGAEDAWYAVAMQMEQMKLKQEEYCGGTADILKFLDQVVREVVYMVAQDAGMPSRILDCNRGF